MSEELTVKQVAAALNCCYDTAHALVADGEFPNAWRRGPRYPWRIPQADVDAYKQRNRARPQDSV